MYLKQMGQVPLLTREQEVEISRRIENAENAVTRAVYCFGFAGKEHIALAEKLLCEPPKERFDRVIVDKKIERREQHLSTLRRLDRERPPPGPSGWMNNTRMARVRRQGPARKLSSRPSRRSTKNSRTSFPEFCFKQKVIEEMMLVAENIRDKMRVSLRTSRIWRREPPARGQQAALESEQRKITALEDFVRLPCADYLKAL